MTSNYSKINIMQKTTPIVRNYREGDEELIVKLWGNAYSSYAGYVPRTIEYWRWCILERLGVSKDDIFIIDKEDKLVAYCVLGPKGKVLELAIDPNLMIKERKKIAELLIHAVEKRAIDRGEESIQIELPFTDKVTSKVLKKLDYRDTPGQMVHGVVINIGSMIEKILNSRKEEVAANWSPAFLLVLNKEHFRFASPDQLLIKFNPEISVESDPAFVSYDIKITFDLTTLTKLIFRQISVDDALKKKCLSISPFAEKNNCCILFKLLALSRPWYIPLADVW